MEIIPSLTESAMKCAVAIIALCLLAAPAAAEQSLICAGNEIPDGMVITSTGTAPSCSGACRARELKPACGPVIKICSDQPIPPGYVLDGITSTPDCQCLGERDNAYVIRYLPEDGDSGQRGPIWQDSSGSGELSAREQAAIAQPYGYPPFHNSLCLEEPRWRGAGQMPGHGGGPDYQPVPPANPSAGNNPSYGLQWQNPELQRSYGASPYQVEPFQPVEPFRIGQ